MKNKRKIIVSIFLVFVLLFTGITFAYFVNSDKKTNKFTVGENKIEIEEEFDLPHELEPGTTYTKKPQITNTGNIPVYVRMSVKYSDESVSKYTQINFNKDKWVYNTTDNYYYYTEEITPGNSCVPLFTDVTILSEIENDDNSTTIITKNDLKNYEIILYAESVQSEFSNDYLSAWDAYNS